jgi:hypothetical protein
LWTALARGPKDQSPQHWDSFPPVSGVVSVSVEN